MRTKERPFIIYVKRWMRQTDTDAQTCIMYFYSKIEFTIPVHDLFSKHKTTDGIVRLNIEQKVCSDRGIGHCVLFHSVRNVSKSFNTLSFCFCNVILLKRILASNCNSRSFKGGRYGNYRTCHLGIIEIGRQLSKLSITRQMKLQPHLKIH